MNLTLYHNPACSKSRQTLELLQQHGLSPNIVEYLKQPPDAATLLRIAAMLEVSVNGMLRPAEADYAALTALVPPEDDAGLAERLAEFPKALQRPIVVDEDAGKAVIGRPPENVLDLIGS